MEFRQIENQMLMRSGRKKGHTPSPSQRGEYVSRRERHFRNEKDIITFDITKGSFILFGVQTIAALRL